MKTFLYATDCTKSSASALKYAYQMSRAVEAELHILHVFDLLPIISANMRTRGILMNNFRDEQQELLSKYCNRHLEEEFGTPDLTYHALRNESVSDAILETADRIDADLVIIGAASSKSLRGLFAENVGDELMPHLKGALLVLPEHPIFHGFSTLLYATDFEEADIIGLEQLVEMAKPFGARIEIVHIPREQEGRCEHKMYWFRKMAMQRISYPEISFGLENAEDVETGLHQCIEQESPEMLAMMERPRTSFWGKLFHRDLVKTMGHEISIGLMVFNKDHISHRQRLEFEMAAV